MAPNLETLDLLISVVVIQCPIEYPFSNVGPNTNYVEQCCKCQSLTKCQAASGANHYYIDNDAANEVVDKSEFSN